MKIGIIREGKTPPDSRVPLIPRQCGMLKDRHSLAIAVQPAPGRCYPDQAYRQAGIPLQENLADCDVLLGVKEVPVDQLISRKTYFFFSHTIKEQLYNRSLLRAVLAKKIRLIDYEVLTNEQGQRLIAFGHFAGMVGAHNALYTFGKHSGLFDLKRMKDFFDYEEAQQFYSQLRWPATKIVLSGGGRVAGGAAMVLKDMGIQQVRPKVFLNESFEKAVFTQLDCTDYVARKDGQAFQQSHFFSHPDLYKSTFAPYTKVADIMINGIYWDPRAPAFFTAQDMHSSGFHIQVIADITCDIAPESSIPATLRATTIENPVLGYHPQSGREVEPFSPGSISMMTIDNLPNELPRDASKAFGEQFMEHILPELLDAGHSEVISRATIAREGQLGKHFQYLQGYVEGT